MMFLTHVAVGILATMMFLEAAEPANGIRITLIVLVASILPDIDHPGSKLGKKVTLVGFFFRHRGFFHSIWPALLGAWILSNVDDYGRIEVFAFLAGYGAHLFADMLTKKGIMPFFPINKSVLKGWIRTGSFAEFLVFIVLVASAAWKVLKF
ncbi:MAG: metal-dependent hydrolase [Nanoarchaeota archaeon]